MVWTVSQTASTLTITPDGTSSENLSTVLDLAISTLGVNAGVTKPSLYTYESTKKILIAADVSTNHLVVSGLNLTLREQFIRASNSRVRFGNVNVAGAVVGKANIIISNTAYGSFEHLPAPFTVGGSNALVDATDLTLIFRSVAVQQGSIVNGYLVAGLSVGSFENCDFQSDDNGNTSNAIFFFSAETFTNCTFVGWSACELTNPNSILKSCIFTTVDSLKNGVAGNFYLEGVSANRFAVQRGGLISLTDCTINLTLNGANQGTVNDRITYRNSLQLLGATNETNGLFVARLASNVQVHKRTFSSSGLISGGNSIGATDGVSTSSERLLISVFRQLGNPLAVNFDYRGLWEAVFVKYGRLPVVFSFNLQGTTATLQNVPFASLPDTGITVSNSATVAAYTTASINHSTGTVTISGATTQRQLHDYCALDKASFADSSLVVAGNPVPRACLPIIGSSIYNRPIGTFLYNLVLASGATLTGTDSIALAAGKNVTLAATGNYSTSPIEVSSTSIVNVAPGNTDLRGWLFASGSIINVSSTTAIVTVDASQLANITAGAGVTIQSPQASIRFFGIPNVANAIISVQDLTSLVITYPTIVAGEVTINVNTARSYKIRADAPGYLASRFFTIPGTTPEFQFNLTDYRALYLSGVNRSSQISFNPTTFVITITDLTLALSFADVFRTIEDYLASQQGLAYTAHPFPIVLPSKNLLWFPSDPTTNAVNPARIKPAPTNTLDPELLFETYLEGATDTTYGLFDFTGAGGRIIRIRSEVAIAQVQGDGSFTISDRVKLEEIKTNTSGSDFVIL